MIGSTKTIFFCLLAGFGPSLLAKTAPSAAKTPSASSSPSCSTLYNKILPKARSENEALCVQAKTLPACKSLHGTQIEHFDFLNGSSKGYKILVFAMIHGDEPLAGKIALQWAERMMKLKNPRNNWRIVPVLNPDGYYANTRMNADGVDLNRNFPSKDWLKDALNYWKRRTRSNPRRFPGKDPGSEPETVCAIEHIKQFQPDFIVSIHSPYGLLDFDGPKTVFPKYKALPWRFLGTYPGSLGRYMWIDHKVPVLTIELKDRLVDAAAIQDMIGGFAMRIVAQQPDQQKSKYSSL